MKRIIIFTVFLVASNLVSAQDFRGGVKLGGNLSWLGDTNGSSTNRTGYVVGFVFAWELEQIGLALELDYSTQGGKIDFPSLNPPISYEEQYNYLNIPVVLKYNMGKGFNFQFGPYFAILINATQREKSGGNETVNNIDDFVGNTDYGFFAGVGYDLEIGLNFEFRYNYGMTDIDSRANVDRRNRFIQLSATYYFIK